uniref:MADS box protein n=1 Tax=Gentiana scabra TaxID=292393 RepID=A0A0K2QQ18_9GENT|nr:MADS box protein [Gentiana scabra]
MGRGKIEIKKIENSTNRQVTYSKRRNGILKKAHELTVLCDAKVSLIMVSGTRRFQEYTSPTTTTKQIIDQYQTTAGVDLWSSHFEKMQENLKRLKEVNSRLKRDIRQRMGEELNDLDMKQLCSLQEKMLDALTAIRGRKYHVIKNQTNTYNKKVKSLEQRHGRLLFDMEPRFEGMILDNNGGGGGGGGGYTTACGGTFVDGDGVPNMYGFAMQPRHHDLQHFRLA